MSHLRMHKQVPEALRAAYRAAVRSGWEVTYTGGGHLKWAPPRGRFVITGSTPRGGRHTIGNNLSLLRKAGLTW